MYKKDAIYHYGIKKYPLDKKMFGVFPHHADYKRSILLRGFDDEFWVPHSRHTTIHREDVEAVQGLKILASSEKAGVYAIMNKAGRQIFITGHSEYDANTLENEYLRDKNQGLRKIRSLLKLFRRTDYISKGSMPRTGWFFSVSQLYSSSQSVVMVSSAM